MDQIFEYLFSAMPFIHALAILAVLLKFILVIDKKGFSFVSIFVSFFRIYTHSDFVMTQQDSRKKYMRRNNIINCYLYAWLFLTIIMMLILQKPF